jgi:hypothetical protein
MSTGPSKSQETNPYQPSQQTNPAQPNLATAGGLGSLSQSARLSSLNTARIILFVIGIVLLVFIGIDLANFQAQVDEARGKHLQINERLVQLGYLIDGGFLAVGAIFIVLGMTVKKHPVPITITGLVLYLATYAVMGYIVPETLYGGIIWKILALVGLVKAIKSAQAYEQERRVQAIKSEVRAGYGR